MSDQTQQRIHEAIAAHIQDLNGGAAEYLTEWVMVATTIIADNPAGSMYYYKDSTLPRHHATGLLSYGLDVISDVGCDCDTETDDD